MMTHLLTVLVTLKPTPQSFRTLKCTVLIANTPNIYFKVTAGSLAEQAGLKVGDMLLQANGQPLSFLTHHEYSKFLLEAGNFIELAIVR
jgi:C-terminal processing protease CtpA/Prc